MGKSKSQRKALDSTSEDEEEELRKRVLRRQETKINLSAPVFRSSFNVIQTYVKKNATPKKLQGSKGFRRDTTKDIQETKRKFLTAAAIRKKDVKELPTQQKNNRKRHNQSVSESTENKKTKLVLSTETVEGRPRRACAVEASTGKGGRSKYVFSSEEEEDSGFRTKGKDTNDPDSLMDYETIRDEEENMETEEKVKLTGCDTLKEAELPTIQDPTVKDSFYVGSTKFSVMRSDGSVFEAVQQSLGGYENSMEEVQELITGCLESNWKEIREEILEPSIKKNGLTEEIRRSFLDTGLAQHTCVDNAKGCIMELIAYAYLFQTNTICFDEKEGPNIHTYEFLFGSLNETRTHFLWKRTSGYSNWYYIVKDADGIAGCSTQCRSSTSERKQFLVQEYTSESDRMTSEDGSEYEVDSEESTSDDDENLSDDDENLSDDDENLSDDDENLSDNDDDEASGDLGMDSEVDGGASEAQHDDVQLAIGDDDQDVGETRVLLDADFLILDDIPGVEKEELDEYDEAKLAFMNTYGYKRAKGVSRPLRGVAERLNPENGRTEWFDRYVYPRGKWVGKGDTITMCKRFGKITCVGPWCGSIVWTRVRPSGKQKRGTIRAFLTQRQTRPPHGPYFCTAEELKTFKNCWPEKPSEKRDDKMWHYEPLFGSKGWLPEGCKVLVNGLVLVMVGVPRVGGIPLYQSGNRTKESSLPARLNDQYRLFEKTDAKCKGICAEYVSLAIVGGKRVWKENSTDLTFFIEEGAEVEVPGLRCPLMATRISNSGKRILYDIVTDEETLRRAGPKTLTKWKEYFGCNYGPRVKRISLVDNPSVRSPKWLTDPAQKTFLEGPIVTDGKGSVYVLQEKKNPKCFKIGFSKDVEKRMAGLSYVNGIQYHKELEVETNFRFFHERIVHSHFANQRAFLDRKSGFTEMFKGETAKYFKEIVEKVGNAINGLERDGHIWNGSS